MGDRWYYISTLTFGEVAKWIRPVDEIHERAEFKTWLQRKVKQERKAEIADYLKSKPQRFFNAVVAGIYGGEPEWIPVTVDAPDKLKDVVMGDRQTASHGFISISGKEDIFAIDGQHRVEGIRTALETDEALRDDELTVIFVAHKMTDEGRERTRRLFTTLNKYAKPVSDAELIALNDDDTFAVVTRRLIDEYPGLGSPFVPLNPTANLQAGDDQSLTSVITLYKVVKELSAPKKVAERKKMIEGPYNEKASQEVYELLDTYWSSLKKFMKPVAEVCASNPEDKVAGKYRNHDGGHLLLRPAGLYVFTQAARVLMNRGITVQEAVKRLAKISLNLEGIVWSGVLWNAANKTMILKNGKLALEIMLHLVGEPPSTKNYQLLTQYRKAVDDPTAKLPV